MNQCATSIVHLRCLFKNIVVPLQAMKGLAGERKYSSYSFLTLVLDRGVSVMPRPCFAPGESTPDTHWTGDWVGFRAGLDAEG
jgi:hypothetical protein